MKVLAAYKKNQNALAHLHHPLFVKYYVATMSLKLDKTNIMHFLSNQF